MRIGQCSEQSTLCVYSEQLDSDSLPISFLHLFLLRVSPIRLYIVRVSVSGMPTPSTLSKPDVVKGLLMLVAMGVLMNFRRDKVEVPPPEEAESDAPELKTETIISAKHMKLLTSGQRLPVSADTDFVIRSFRKEPTVLPRRPEHVVRSLALDDYKIVYGNETSTEGAGGDEGGGDDTAEAPAEGGSAAKASAAAPTPTMPKRNKVNIAVKGLPEVEVADIERAQQAVIYPMAKLEVSSIPGSRPAALYNFLASFMQEAQVDSDPLVADFGCNVGPYIAWGNENATVLCFAPGKESGSSAGNAMGAAGGVGKVNLEANGERNDGAQNEGRETPATENTAKKKKKKKATLLTVKSLFEDAGGSQPSRALTNLFPATAKGGFLGYPFSLVYKSCHIFSTTFVLNTTFATPAFSCDRVTRLASNILRMSKTTFLTVPVQCLGKLQKVVDDLNKKSTFQLDVLGAIIPESFESSEQSPQTKSEDGSADGTRQVPAPTAPKMDNPDSSRTIRTESPAFLVRIVMEKHTRPGCHKLWGKAKVGKRESAFVYEAGSVTINVRDTVKNKFLRRIHPLSYIVSSNVDTLISIGVPRSTSQRILGQMIQVPFYHDPFPQNWVISGGGQVVRIDKDDKNYLAHKGELHHYWARSTRGYFHLLGAHLCLPISNGLPSILVREACGSTCVPCVLSCNVTAENHGKPPCSKCMDCGKCVVDQSLKNAQQERDNPEKRKACPAEKAYGGSIWLKGREHWKRWELADKKNPLYVEDS
jgi:hypothetical protein